MSGKSDKEILDEIGWPKEEEESDEVCPNCEMKYCECDDK